MAKFVFKLQSYLGVKEKLENQKKLAYGHALTQLELEKQKKRQLLQEKDQQTHNFRTQIATRINPKQFIGYNDFIQWLDGQIVLQDAAIAKAEQLVETARLALVEAMKERKMLETLREHKLEEYIKEEQITEQKTVDELISYRFNNRLGNSEGRV